MAREQLQTLTEPMYYTLLALTKPRHGYDVMQNITALTNSRISVGAGTLYSLLSRFEAEGIIEQTAVDGRRKIYLLTEKGRGLLDEEYQRLQQLVADGATILEQN